MARQEASGSYIYVEKEFARGAPCLTNFRPCLNPMRLGAKFMVWPLLVKVVTADGT
jgi:hypothetical protein